MAGLSPRARAWVISLATLSAVLLTARLGVWQLDRAAQKAALHSAVLERAQLPPLRAEALLAAPGEAETQLHRLVRLRGRWLSEHTVYLDNRPMNGRVGFFVVTPLQLSERPDIILVQRGWGPRDARDRSRLPGVQTPTGEVELLGRLTVAPSRAYEFSAAGEGPIRQNLDPASLVKALPAPLLPLTVLQLPDADATPAAGAASSPPADGLWRDWPAQDAGLQKHHGYAFQWFALSALLLGLYVWFQTIRPRIRSRRSEHSA
ncbi:SURF1 family protein [Paucibacter aquatile]|nr:SURF1 family protein [Paucibacter aquatile]WIV96707.1 SURF1 family protein [Paucibacter aquatile]